MIIPQGQQDLTPRWLTQALRETGTIARASVVSVETHELAGHTGITGQLARLHLAYDVREEGAPRTLIAKLPLAASPGPTGPGREVRFYRELAPQIDLPTPRCYYGDANDLGQAVLLIEDLAPARSGDILTRDSLPKAEHAIRELARFHAAWWADPRLDEMDWLMRFDRASVETLVEAIWEPFLHKAGHKLPDRAMLERLHKHVAYVYDRVFWQPPLTLLHADYQADNLFYATPEGGVPFAVIDWQNLSLGRGAWDVSYYLCRGAPPEERRAIERRLLVCYHTTLVENGVQGYTFEQCVDDYRLSTLLTIAWLGYPIAQVISPEHEPLYVDLWLPQVYAAAVDLDAIELLPE
jgi:aminoglycoside phosphotransferase (APT) family kinase protein